MEAIRIKGLRSLTDTGFVQIKPINILVGANSSGKSTFLRSFPLIRQSVERRTRGPILWNGIFTDFESFSTSLNRNPEKDTPQSDHIEFSFKIPFTQFRDNAKPTLNLKASVCIKESSSKNSCYTHKFSVDTGSHELHFEFEQDGVIKRVYSNRINWPLDKNDIKFQLANTDTILPVIGASEHLFPYRYRSITNDQKTISGSIFRIIIKLIEEYTQSTSKNKINEITRSLVRVMRTEEEKLSFIKSIRSTKQWRERISQWNLEHNDFIFLSALIDICTIINNSFEFNLQLNSIFKNVRYIAPLRASTERYYRYQDLNIDELDHRGENIGMFLTNIPKRWRSKLDEWTGENFEFIISEVTTSSHTAINLRHINDSVSTNVADMGFGYSQILPIIIQLWSISSGYERSINNSRSIFPYIFTIEQPELHLHPKIQATLAKVFSKSIELANNNNIDLRLIIETHSSAMISKFGDIIAIGEYDYDDINVMIFEQNHSQRETKISYSTFNEDGELENWPSGFFNY